MVECVPMCVFDLKSRGEHGEGVSELGAVSSYVISISKINLKFIVE